MISAFLVSRWVWKKRIDLKKFLQPEQPREMSDDEMLAKVRALNTAMGGEIIAETRGDNSLCREN